MGEEIKQRRLEMNNWVKFCKQKIEKIEKVWNKKLEDSTNDEDSEENATGGAASNDEDD